MLEGNVSRNLPMSAEQQMSAQQHGKARNPHLTFWRIAVPRGASPKREREYEELKQKFEKSGRYGNRADQVAARIVNKQRAQYGETKGEKKEEKEGKNPDRNLPLDHYRHLTIGQLKARLKGLSKGDLKKIKGYEEKHKARKGAIAVIDSELSKKSH